jgi:hypothetical protein
LNGENRRYVPHSPRFRFAQAGAVTILMRERD